MPSKYILNMRDMLFNCVNYALSVIDIYLDSRNYFAYILRNPAYMRRNGKFLSTL